MDAIEKWAAMSFVAPTGQLQWIIAEALRKKRADEETGRILLR